MLNDQKFVINIGELNRKYDRDNFQEALENYKLLSEMKYFTEENERKAIENFTYYIYILLLEFLGLIPEIQDIIFLKKTLKREDVIVKNHQTQTDLSFLSEGCDKLVKYNIGTKINSFFLARKSEFKNVIDLDYIQQKSILTIKLGPTNTSGSVYTFYAWYTLQSKVEMIYDKIIPFIINYSQEKGLKTFIDDEKIRKNLLLQKIQIKKDDIDELSIVDDTVLKMLILEDEQIEKKIEKKIDLNLFDIDSLDDILDNNNIKLVTKNKELDENTNKIEENVKESRKIENITTDDKEEILKPKKKTSNKKINTLKEKIELDDNKEKTEEKIEADGTIEKINKEKIEPKKKKIKDNSKKTRLEPTALDLKNGLINEINSLDKSNLKLALTDMTTRKIIFDDTIIDNKTCWIYMKPMNTKKLKIKKFELHVSFDVYDVCSDIYGIFQGVIEIDKEKQANIIKQIHDIIKKIKN